jgi:hypothetical protein
MAIAIPLVLLIGTKSELPLPKIPLHDIAASGILFALVIVFAWRYYEHMRDKKALARLLERKEHHQQETTEDSQTP